MALGLHNIESATSAKLTLRKVRAIPQLNEADRARFWGKVERGAQDDCWLWNGSGVPGGHGTMLLCHRSKWQPYYAHRIAWTIVHGEIPAGAAVLHRCDVPRCVNPSHLFVGTQGDNVRDASRKGRLNIARKRTRGIKPAVIATYLNGGVTAKQLAAQFDISFMTVHRWIREATGGVDQRSRNGNHKGTKGWNHKRSA
jgi:hypothetical protein